MFSVLVFSTEKMNSSDKLWSLAIQWIYPGNTLVLPDTPTELSVVTDL